ncbi:chorismate--pyruvate lyase family protein [Nocardia jiangsuensis]|uniref:Chorismate--pyruvate lyase family protein n=1 Tax=Nocardia jiangsuensis TaxID=1691563 RepID=A0ABV8DP71_9NOCA
MRTDVATSDEVAILLRRHFRAHGTQPENWFDLPIDTLSPFHRNILVTDGTVTRALEAYALEPIEAQCVDQYVSTDGADHDAHLEVTSSEPVLVRRVELIGAWSGTRYVRARSLIAVDRLPQAFHGALAVEPAGIGAALRVVAPDSHRELLCYGRPPEAICARRYRVVVHGRPAMIISEFFLR